MRRPAVGLVISLAGAVALIAADVRAQSHGPDEQILTIGAAEFLSVSGEGNGVASDGYVYLSGFLDSYIAPVRLPEGAHLTGICLYSYDADLSENLLVDLVAARLVRGGETPHASPDFGVSVESIEAGGYEADCTPAAHTLRGKIDVDEDGVLDDVAYYIVAGRLGAGELPIALGGVRIAWKRQVSTPPATPTFADVPPSDAAFPFVEALAASGITAGCAGGDYCPNATLTRRQMAVFLSKALGLHWAE